VRDLPFKRIHLVWATTDEGFRPTISHRHGGREADKWIFSQSDPTDQIAA